MAITEMARADVPESVMKSMAGHMSRKMLEHHTHVRLDAKRWTPWAVPES